MSHEVLQLFQIRIFLLLQDPSEEGLVTASKRCKLGNTKATSIRACDKQTKEEAS